MPFALHYIEKNASCAVRCLLSCCSYVFMRIRVLPEEPFFSAQIQHKMRVGFPTLRVLGGMRSPVDNDGTLYAFAQPAVGNSASTAYARPESSGRGRDLCRGSFFLDCRPL